MMGRRQAPLLQRALRRLGLGGEGKKPPEALLIARLCPLRSQRRGVLRVCASGAAIVTASRTGKPLVVPIQTQAVWGRCERQGVAGVVGWAGRAVGLEGHATWPGGAPLRHGGQSARVQRQRAQRSARGVP